MQEWNLETMAVQGAYQPASQEPRVLPLFQSTTFRYDTSDYLADLFDLKAEGHLYSRISNPTVDCFEKKVALMEGGVAALATSSGQAALMIAIMNIAKAGDSILSSSTVYGGTFTLFDKTFKNMGIEVILFDPDATATEIEALAKENTKAIYGEVIANPKLNVLDLDKLSAISKNLSIPFIVDNTFPTPCLCRPIEFGADVVVHSSSKYLDGHASCLGGVIVDAGTFNYANGKFAEFTEPDESYHGVVYAQDFSACPYIVKARVQLMRNTGMTASPFNSYITNLGMETLHLRMERHSENALKIAEFLSNHPKVSWVKYPGLKGDAYFESAQKYLKKGSSGVLSFGTKGGKETSKKVVDNLKLIALVTHVADVRSSVLQPATTTHRQLSSEQLEKAGVSEDLIRLSVGIENVHDIIADLEQALNLV